jgi:CheY-like chemotaxis protein
MVAESAEIGLNIIVKDQPDLILMDINLPGMDGIEALAVNRRNQKWQDIRVYALSANAMASEVNRGTAAGLGGYLTKPLEVERLGSILDSV